MKRFNRYKGLPDPLWLILPDQDIVEVVTVRKKPNLKKPATPARLRQRVKPVTYV